MVSPRLHKQKSQAGTAEGQENENVSSVKVGDCSPELIPSLFPFYCFRTTCSLQHPYCATGGVCVQFVGGVKIHEVKLGF